MREMIRGIDCKFNLTIYSEIRRWCSYIYQITLNYLIFLTCDFIVKINTHGFSSLS